MAWSIVRASSRNKKQHLRQSHNNNIIMSNGSDSDDDIIITIRSVGHNNVIIMWLPQMLFLISWWRTDNTPCHFTTQVLAFAAVTIPTFDVIVPLVTFLQSLPGSCFIIITSTLYIITLWILWVILLGIGTCMNSADLINLLIPKNNRSGGGWLVRGWQLLAPITCAWLDSGGIIIVTIAFS